MAKTETEQKDTADNINKKIASSAQEGIAKAESLLPEGSWQRTTAGVAAAAGGGLLAAAMVGVGPAALAGVAGYLAYKSLRGPKKNIADDTFKH